jgi:nucleoid-associated protein YgaU
VARSIGTEVGELYETLTVGVETWNQRERAVAAGAETVAPDYLWEIDDYALEAEPFILAGEYAKARSIGFEVQELYRILILGVEAYKLREVALAVGAETVAPEYLWEIDDYALGAEPLILAGEYAWARNIGAEAGELYETLTVGVQAWNQREEAVAAGAEIVAPVHLREIDDYALSAEPLIIAGDYAEARSIGTEAGELYETLTVGVQAWNQREGAVAVGAEIVAPDYLWEIDDYALSAEPLILAGEYGRARSIGTEAGGLYRTLAVDVAAGRFHGETRVAGAGHVVPEHITEYDGTIAELRSAVDTQQRIIADYQNIIAEHRVIIDELRSTIDRQQSVINEFQNIVAELLLTIRETQAMAHQVLGTPASVTGVHSTPPLPSSQPLPARYTVRSTDSLWKIAGYPWVYNDPMRWSTLYNANRARMPQPDNPDLIHPGMVLEIPSIRGELREGMWDSTRVYPTGGVALSAN